MVYVIYTTTYREKENQERERERMDFQKIVVVVEDVEAARTALQWALINIIRYGDIITLLHVYNSRSRSRNKARLLRLNGFRLALSFQDICNNYPNVCYQLANQLYIFFNVVFVMLKLTDMCHNLRIVLQTKVEIIVTEGDQEGTKIASTVREIGASMLVLGLHDHSFLYK